MSTDSFTRLFHLKLVALLHDPPHKSGLIAKYGADYGVKHREIAKALLNSITANTSLTPVLDSSVIDCVNLIDRVASTLDRWVLRRVQGVLGPSRSYVYYDKLHNIFNPRIYTELPKMDVDELEK